MAAHLRHGPPTGTVAMACVPMATGTRAWPTRPGVHHPLAAHARVPAAHGSAGLPRGRERGLAVALAILLTEGYMRRFRSGGHAAAGIRILRRNAGTWSPSTPVWRAISPPTWIWPAGSTWMARCRAWAADVPRWLHGAVAVDEDRADQLDFQRAGLDGAWPSSRARCRPWRSALARARCGRHEARGDPV